MSDTYIHESPMPSAKNSFIAALTVLSLAMLPASAATAGVPQSIMDKKGAVVTIYVEDSNGARIATGSGFVIKPDGLIITHQNVVLKWLGSGDNSLFVKTHGSGYFPLKSIVLFDRKNGIALVRVDADGLTALEPGSRRAPVKADRIVVLGSPDGFETAALEGNIKGFDADGGAVISVPVTAALQGSPVFNLEGEVIGLAAISGGRGVSVPAVHIETLLKASIIKARKELSAEMDRLDEAIAGVKTDAGSAGAHYKLGVAYKRSGRNEEAIGAFRKALSIKPDYAEAYNGLGAALAGAGKHREAIDALREAIKLEPGFAEALANLGFIYDYMGRHAEAVEAFHEALRARPEYADAYNGLGVAYAREGNFGEAVEAFGMALRIRPESRKARFNLGLSYLMLGEPDAALRQHSVLEGLDMTLAGQLLEIIEAYLQGAAEEEPGLPQDESAAGPD